MVVTRFGLSTVLMLVVSLSHADALAQTKVRFALDWQIRVLRTNPNGLAYDGKGQCTRMHSHPQARRPRGHQAAQAPAPRALLGRPGVSRLIVRPRLTAKITVLIILVLIFRPTGLLGERVADRA